jgi:hypothetical protein
MRKLNCLIIGICSAILGVLPSCEEVIQLDLKKSEPRTVIEASINATLRTCNVQVTKSLGFYQTDSVLNIEGAMVQLISSSSAAICLSPVGPGMYSAGNLTIIPGEVLRISVTISADEQYSAETKVPRPVFLDSLKVVPGIADPRLFGKVVYNISPKWKDPGGAANYYRFKITHNGIPHVGMSTITDDVTFDGMDIDYPLYWFAFDLKDTVRLEFQSMDSLSYRYYEQVNVMSLPSFVSATPYNPIGNFDNGALGFFGIYFVDIWDEILSVER